MIVVIDTNVLVSALLSPSGFPSQIIQLWQNNELEVAISKETKTEYQQVLIEIAARYPAKIQSAEMNILLGNLTINTIIQTQHPLYTTKDPEDNKFIECAIESHAQIIITGNQKHFPQAYYNGIPVLSPKQFIQAWDLLRQKGSTAEYINKIKQLNGNWFDIKEHQKSRRRSNKRPKLD